MGSAVRKAVKLAMVAVVLLGEASATTALGARQLIFGRRQLIQGVGGFGRFNNVDFDENIKEVPGFSKLKNVNNQLVELNRFGQLNPLFIDPRSGQLLGATEIDTIRQAKEFFLANLDNFNGNALNVVRRFLAANGAGQAIFGGLNVDLASSVMPETTYGKANGDAKVKLATLNYFLNMISQSRTIARVGRAAAVVGLNVNGLISGEKLALLTNGYPYACSGTGTEPFRLDWLVSRAMDPEIYYQMIGAPRNYNDLARQLGTEVQRRRTLGNKIAVAGVPGKPESIVGKHPQRMLEVQNEGNVVGGSLYVSYDNPYNLPPGVKSESADIFRNGVDTTFAAGEMIFHKPNGFLGFYLANAAGQRQNSAPNEIASSAGWHGEAFGKRAGNSGDVSSPANCLICHAGGFLGGQISAALSNPGEKKFVPYTDNFGKIPAFSKQFFTTTAVYAARARRDSQVFMNSLVRAGAYIPDPQSAIGRATNRPTPAPLLPDMVGAYQQDMTVAQAAKELGVPPERLQGLLRTNKDGKIHRSQFESAYCSLKALLGGGGQGLVSAGSFQQPIGSGALGLRSFSSTSHLPGDVTGSTPGGRRFAQ